MPTESKEKTWSRESVGWHGVKDVSLPKIDKAEAVANLHQFLFHRFENKVTIRELGRYIIEATKVLTFSEIAEVCISHLKMKIHHY